MNKVPFTKAYTSVTDQINHLRQKGLNINNQSLAEKKLTTIGYERLRIYFLSKRDITQPGKPFYENISFENILEIYEIDRKIRVICLGGLGRLEIIFRNYVSDYLGKHYGSHPLDNGEIYRIEREKIEKQNYLLNVFDKSSDARAKHYKTNYYPPLLPPIWTLKEFMTFGQMSRFFQSLKKEIRVDIGKKFDINKDSLFINWIKALNDLRNFCAHHERIFNRTFQKDVSFNDIANVPDYNESTMDKNCNKLKHLLQCLDFLLEKAGEEHDYTRKIHDLISNCPLIEKSKSGFYK